MKIKIVDHTENTARVIEYPLTLRDFVYTHFFAFGLYGVGRIEQNKYEIYDGFDGARVYTVSKAGAREPVTE